MLAQGELARLAGLGWFPRDLLGPMPKGGF
jgi:hypothetical protein